MIGFKSMDLLTRSIEIILENQHQSGAYVACPNFPNYRYCWLRDGSFIAHAMDSVGEHSSAERYFHWVDQVICRYTSKVELLEEKFSKGEAVKSNENMHTRFTLEGFEDTKDEGWGNFQIDGYGTWLWALAAHIRLTGKVSLLSQFSNSISTTIRYLKLVWNQPNYDCWEEFPQYVHPYSVAAVYAGFSNMEQLFREHSEIPSSYPLLDYARKIKEYIQLFGVAGNTLIKHVRPASGLEKPSAVVESGVDASLLGVIHPYAVFARDDPVALNTVAKIETDLLRKNGGMYRYVRDQYYGGGEWILLAAWLGWYYNLTGREDRAADIALWIENQADASGHLPEQVSDHALSPKYYPEWHGKWGEIASPLLWSHAMYIILKKSQ